MYVNGDAFSGGLTEGWQDRISYCSDPATRRMLRLVAGPILKLRAVPSLKLNFTVILSPGDMWLVSCGMPHVGDESAVGARAGTAL